MLWIAAISTSRDCGRLIRRKRTLLSGLRKAFPMSGCIQTTWIKQHLRIEVFWGYSQNAVKTQICIALCTFLLVAIMKKKLGIQRNLYEILQILSASQFEKTPINTLLSELNLRILEDQAQKRLFSLDF